ncbi:DNRLRE domain-containing protein [Conexibacter woesei]|uniref:DNRLRE domain-containing protein n=1 Tax=Conexibacter woesei TaxID=191495 RepID=UPI00135F1AF3|nr:DNRLRE domain-containing protein [Conexibacter woesei]
MFGVVALLGGATALAADPWSGGPASSVSGAAPQARAPVEVPSLRTEFSQTRRLADGTYEARISNVPVNYRGADGGWEPVDDRLVATADGSLENVAGPLDVVVPADASGAVTIAGGDHELSFALTGGAESSTVRADGSEATFGDAIDGVDVGYELQGDVVKETLTLASSDVPSSYRFDVDAPGLHAAVDAAGDVDFTDGSGQRRFTFQAPWMKDASGAMSQAARYEVESGDGRQVVVLVLDRAWLSDPARAFPVVVDPTTTWEGPARVCEIKSGAAANTSNCGTTLTTFVGKDGTQTRRGLIALRDLNQVIRDDALVLQSHVNAFLVGQSAPATADVDLHHVTSSFTSSATWNRRDGTTAWRVAGGDFRSPREARETMAADRVGHWAVWDMTELMQAMVDGREPSQNLMLKAADESRQHLDSFDQHEIYVRYATRTGVGPQYSYDRHRLSDGSELLVNVGNENMALVSDDLGFENGNDRLTVARYFNTENRFDFGGTFGNGTRGDFGTITLEQDDADGSYVLFGVTGLDGVFHKRADGSFASPVGMDASLHENQDGTITVAFDDTLEVWTFGAGDPVHRLLSTRAVDGYQVDATYYASLGDRLRTLADNRGRLMRFEYDPVGDVTVIRDQDGATHRYGYDNHTLTSYTTPAGAQTRYTYDDRRLMRIDLPDGRAVKLAYWPDSTFVASITPVTGGVDQPATTYDGAPGHADVTAADGRRRRYTFGADSLLATSMTTDVTPQMTLALGGRLKTSAFTTLANGVYPLTFTASDSAGIARVELTVDGFAERTWSWDCSGRCAATQAGSWSLNTGDFPPGDHTIRLTATDATGEQRAEAFRVTVPYTGLLVSPRSRVQPVITGRAADGETLGIETNHWTGAHPKTFQPQWRRCNAAGTACQDIAGENDWRYVATGADVGSTLLATVRGRNFKGVGTTNSAAFGPIATSPPVNVQLPEILGRPNIVPASSCGGGDCPPEGTLVVDDGIWRGTGPVTLSYQWEECTTADPSSCRAVTDATGGTYEVPAAYNAWMRVTVTALSPYGTATASSLTRLIGYAPTTEQGDIAFAGSARVGSVLTAVVPDPGIAWSAQWMRCNPDGGDCRPIGGATGSTYLVTTEDLGQRLRLRVVYDGGQNLDDSGTSAIVRGALLAPRRFALVLDSEELWTAKLDGTDPRKVLTVSYADDLKDIAVSPDGDTVAMITSRGIELVGINGRGRRLLLNAPSAGGSGDGPQSPSSVAFSPTGDGLAIAAYSPVDFATGIYSLDIATGTALRLDAGWTPDVPYTDRDLPSYSPDGGRLTYLARNGSQTAIVTAAANGTGERAVEIGGDVQQDTVTSKPRFSEDNSMIVFSGLPLGDYCGYAIHGIDIATQTLTPNLPSQTRNCNLSFTAPSWTGPGSTVLTAYSYDTSPTSVATGIKTVDVETGDLDLLVPSTGKPITALELPQVSVPAVSVEAENDEVYSNGTDPAVFRVRGVDRALGIQTFGYGPSATTPTDTWTVECDSLCPRDVTHEFSVVTTRLPEGANTLAAWAQNAAGTTGHTSGRVIVDRTAPVAAADAGVYESGATAQTATVSWYPGYDGDLPGGIPGAGVAEEQVRWSTPSTGWSAWQDAAPGFVELRSIASNTQITVEIRTTDTVGNSSTYSGEADWSPPPPDPDEEITGIDWDDEEPGFSALIGRRCTRASLTGPGLTNYNGQFASGVLGKAEVTCPASGMGRKPRLNVELCVLTDERDPGTFDTEIDCDSVVLREKTTAYMTAATECRPDTQSYLLRVRAWSVPVRRGSSWTKTSSIRSLDCNNAGAWRSKAARDPSGELARNLSAADDRPPRNLDGSTTGTHNGFVARHLIPPQDELELAAHLQALAWSCGITPNDARNGVWLRGTTLKNVGDGGARRASARFRAVSNDGQDRAYHEDLTILYYRYVFVRLDAARESSGNCPTARAAGILAQVRQELKDGVIGGGANESLRQVATKYAPKIYRDMEEPTPLLSPQSIVSNVARHGSSVERNRLCRGRNPCDPLATAGGSPELTLPFLRSGRYPSGARVSGRDYLDEVGTEEEKIQDSVDIYGSNPDWQDPAYVRFWTSGSVGWVQYWLFYYYNTAPAGFEQGHHEGDWEMVQVRYRRESNGLWSDPDRVTYSNHRDAHAISCPWSTVDEVDPFTGETSFQVYPGAGTHANFHRPGVFDGAAFGLAKDLARGQNLTGRPRLRFLAAGASWLRWPGRWGSTEQGASPTDSPSPLGPAQQGKKWDNPSAFDAQARRCEDVEPESEIVGGRQAAPLTIDDARYEDGAVQVDWESNQPDRDIEIVWTVTPADEVGAVSQIIPVRGASGRVTIPWRRGQAPAKVRATEVGENGSRSPIVIEHQVDG